MHLYKHALVPFQGILDCEHAKHLAKTASRSTPRKFARVKMKIITLHAHSCSFDHTCSKNFWRSIDLHVCCSEFEPEGDVQEATYQLDQKSSPNTSHDNIPVLMIFVAFLIQFRVDDVAYGSPIAFVSQTVQRY